MSTIKQPETKVKNYKGVASPAFHNQFAAQPTGRDGTFTLPRQRFVSDDEDEDDFFLSGD